MIRINGVDHGSGSRRLSLAMIWTSELIARQHQSSDCSTLDRWSIQVIGSEFRAPDKPDRPTIDQNFASGIVVLCRLVTIGDQFIS
jgi:hypothetical protein